MDHSRRAALGRLGIAAAAGSLLGLAGAPAEPASATTPTDRVDVLAHGAVADDGTDCAPAIRRAIAAVARRPTGAGVVWFPPGFYAVGSPIEVPKNVVLTGESPIATRLRYSGGPAEAFITFGSPGRIATFSGIRGLWVNAAGRARTTVLLHGPQEGSTVADTIAEGATDSVIEVRSAGIEGGSNKFTIERSWLWTTGDAATAGVRIGAGSGPLTIRDTTMVGTKRSGRAPAGSAGVVATRSIVTLDGVNVEHFDAHTHLDRTQADVRGATGFFNRYGVVTTAASTASSLVVVNADFDQADQCVVDRGAGVTIRYCRSYSNESYRHDRRHFRGGEWALGGANVYQSAQQQAVMGFSGPAGRTSAFTFSTLLKKGWRQSARIDRDGVFGTVDSAFDGAHFRMGDYHRWVDAKGRLRIKRSAPRHDRDGRVVGR